MDVSFEFRRQTPQALKARCAARMRARLDAERRRARDARLTPAAVACAVGLAFEIDAGFLRNPSRRARFVWPRFAFAWLCRHRSGEKLDTICFELRRDRSTIVNALRRAETLRVIERDFAVRLARAEFELWAAEPPTPTARVSRRFDPREDQMILTRVAQGADFTAIAREATALFGHRRWPQVIGARFSLLNRGRMEA